MDKEEKEYTTGSKIILIGIALTLLMTAIVNQSFNIGRLIGSAIALLGFSVLLGSIPYFIFRKKTKNPAIKIFGVLFILLGLFAISGTILGELRVKTDITNPNNEAITEVKIDKSESNSEIIGNMYRNIKYGFRIKFPKGWKMEIGDGEHIVQKAVSGNSSLMLLVFQMDLAETEGFLSIKDDISIDEYVELIMKEPKEKYSDVKIISSGETKIDNESAYWVEFSATYQVLETKVNMTTISYSLAKNDKMYIIQGGTATDEYKQTKPEFIKSVSTFVLEK